MIELEMKEPVEAGQDLEITVALLNDFSEEPVGTVVVASAGIYDYDRSGQGFIDKYCDGMDEIAMRIVAEPGKILTHSIKCPIPVDAREGETDLIVKVGMTDKIGSMNPDDYTFVQESYYKFNLTKKAKFPINIPQVIMSVAAGLFSRGLVGIGETETTDVW